MSNERRFGRGAIVALVIAHCAGMLDLVALPVWVGALVERFGFSPQQAGVLATLFLVGGVAASLVVSPRFVRLRHRPVAVVGFLLAAASFAAAATRRDFGTLAALHLLAGVMSGTSLSMVHGAMSRSENPHRLFATASIAIGLFGILVLSALPQLLIARGGAVMFLVFAGVVSLGALVCAVAFPQVGASPGSGAAQRAPASFPPAVWLLIGGTALLALNQAMVFSFAEVIGKARGFAPQAVLGVLAAMGLCNFLLPAPLAIFLQKRVHAERVIVIGPIVQALLALVITMASRFPVWAPATAVFVTVMIFTHTFVFGLLSRLDSSGRAAAATPAMLMTGAALGPVLGGALGQRFGFQALGVAAVLVAAGAVALFRHSRKLSLPQAIRSNA